MGRITVTPPKLLKWFVVIEVCLHFLRMTHESADPLKSSKIHENNGSVNSVVMVRILTGF